MRDIFTWDTQGSEMQPTEVKIKNTSKWVKFIYHITSQRNKHTMGEHSFSEFITSLTYTD